MNEWKPIDSAPKGRDILVYCPDPPEQMVAFWSEYDKVWQFAYYGSADAVIHCNPSHWMELPEPPK